VVVADNSWRAQQASTRCRSRSTKGKARATLPSRSSRAWKRRSPKGGLKKDFAVGDADAALRSAAKIVDQTYRLPYLAHACMEPMNCTASFAGREARALGGFQDGLGARMTAAKLAGMPWEKVTLHHTAMGGGFGRAGRPLNYLEEAIEIAKQARPAVT